MFIKTHPMKTLAEFLAEHPELQELDYYEQQFEYEMYLSDYRYALNRLAEDPDEYGDY
jgi:hypothetical protein